jgi:radical SAM superfamily enzyme YgiQ (UPF0313 family)
MPRPLKIYLGDLTYDTVTLSTEVFPLNIGYIAAYALERFGEQIEVRLFKYIADLDRALNQEPPDLLGLSNYCWNRRVGLEMFRILLRQKPSAVTVWGGPNFPLDSPSRQEFMDRNQEVDAYIPVEGEIGFGNLVQQAVDEKSLAAAKAMIRTASIDGCVTRTREGAFQYKPVVRMGALDAIPSPFLSGLMDPFFDGRLMPMIQTNRGCPFTCTFCVDGGAQVSKVNFFTLDRVRQELEYIGPRVPSTTHGMEISDLNFGMYERDVEICDAIHEIQKRYHWPKHITTSTGKNRKERIIEAVRRLNGTLRLSMSVQSMNPDVLLNIKRHNISVDAMMALAPKVKEAGLRTHSEIILALPGDTYDAYLQTIRDLINANVDFIKGYTLMLLPGSQLATPAERRRWSFITKFRPLTMDFAELSNGRKVIETEEVVVGSSTLSYSEYVDLRVLAFTLWVMTRGGYDALLKFFKEKGADVVELLLAMKSAQEAPAKIAAVLEAFRQATIRELWDSPKEIEEHYQKDDAYQKLLQGQEGVNLLNYFGGIVTAEHIEEWTEYSLQVARKLLRHRELGPKSWREFESVATYCQGVTSSLMEEGRLDRNKETELDFDIGRWLQDETGRTLDQFELNPSRRVSFQLAQDQVTLLTDLVATYGNTPAGLGQALKYIPENMLWRHSVVKQDSP